LLYGGLLSTIRRRSGLLKRAVLSAAEIVNKKAKLHKSPNSFGAVLWVELVTHSLKYHSIPRVLFQLIFTNEKHKLKIENRKPGLQRKSSHSSGREARKRPAGKKRRASFSLSPASTITADGPPVSFRPRLPPFFPHAIRFISFRGRSMIFLNFHK
jgi:hypothetical protein